MNPLHVTMIALAYGLTLAALLLEVLLLRARRRRALAQARESMLADDEASSEASGRIRQQASRHVRHRPLEEAHGAMPETVREAAPDAPRDPRRNQP